MFFRLRMVDQLLTKGFYWLGFQIGKRPSYFIIVPIFVALVLVTGMQRFRYEDDPEYLFSPVNGEAKHARSVVEEHFPMNYSGEFNPGRITRPGRFARLIVLAKDGGSLLRKHIWDDILRVDKLLHDVSFEWDDVRYKYKDICAISDEHCYENDVLELGELMEDIEARRMNLTYPIMLNPVTFNTYAFPFSFGGVKISEVGTVLEVKALILNYFVATNVKKDDDRGHMWETTLLETLEKNEFQEVTVARFCALTLATELERNTSTVMPYISITVLIMLVFSVTTCMMSDWVRSKPWLGVAGVISATIGTGAAFGIIMYCGLEFIGINLATPFLMLGIGIDDTFVMLAAWRRTTLHESIPARMGKMYADAAVSITITSLTDILSFWVGVLTPFPCVRIFSIYTGTAVICTYLWHITFFGGCIALSGYHERENRHSVFCWLEVTPKSESVGESCLHRYFCTGGISRRDPYNPDDNKEHSLMLFFRNKVARLLNIPAVKALVVMVFLMYLGVAVWGITKVQEGLERRKLSRYDSYSVDYYDREDLYFREYPYRVQVVLSGEQDYSDPDVQRDVEELLQTFEASAYVGTSLFTESWLRSFLGYVERSREFQEYNISTQQDFIDTLRDVYLSGTFALDVRFDANYTKILSSRFVIQTVNISTANEEKDMVAALRKICEESKFNVTVFHPYFVFFDQFLLVLPTSWQCILIAGIIMLVVALIFIPNPQCCLWVFFSIMSIEAGVVGYMTLWHVNLDAISMINLIMCIGFSVDFSAHISYAYMSSQVESPEERVQECLYALGMPILQGALSTILGVVALTFAPSYIFVTFFKTIFLVIFFGAMHGLFLLPVLLSIMGPGSCSRKSKSLSFNNKSLPPHPFFIATHPPLDPAKCLVPGITMLALPKDSSKPRPPRDRYPLDKDLGLGTSGEESSESSLSKAQGSRGASEHHKRKACPSGFSSGYPSSGLPTKSGPYPVHIKELYSNAGYMSDDEATTSQRHRSRHYHHHHHHWPSARVSRAHSLGGGGERERGRAGGGGAGGGGGMASRPLPRTPYVTQMKFL